MLDRSVAPNPGELQDFNFPQTQRDRLSVSQVPYILIQESKQPIIYAELIFDSGKWYEQSPGQAHLSAKMLLEGTSKWNSEEIAVKIEAMGSFVETGSGLDHSFIRIYCLTKAADKTFRLLEEVLKEASYPSAEFEITRNIRSQQIASQHSQQPHLSTLSFYNKLFGDQHPQGRITKPSDVEELQIEQVRGYHQSHLFANPRLILAGDVNENVLSIIDDFCQSIPSAQTEATKFDAAVSPGVSRTTTEKSQQASVRIGKHIIDKGNRDIHKLTIANSLLGGFFGSRLMKSIREEKGLTYGIHASLVHSMNTSVWLISSEMQSAKLDEGIEAINHELKKLVENTPNEEEILTLKNFLRGKLLNSLDSIFNVAGVYRSLFVHELPDQYLTEYLNQLNRLEGEDISEMIGKYLVGDTDMVTLVRN